MAKLQQNSPQLEIPKKRNWTKTIILGLQHVFAMFGATVLVPTLTGLSIPVALFSAGAGTLIFHLITKGKVPVFLGSSFAFIAAIIMVATHHSQGAALGTAAYASALPYATGGIIIAGSMYLILAALVKIFGVAKIRSFFPPVVVGPMIIIIGMTLAPTAISSITSGPTELAGVRWIIALSVIITMIAISIFAKGFFKLVPIIIALAVGYVVSIIFGQVDFSTIQNAAWVASPEFFLPKFSLFAALTIAPIAIVTFMEHIGDITTNSLVVGKTSLKTQV